jgi:hypothetical protein
MPVCNHEGATADVLAPLTGRKGARDFLAKLGARNSRSLLKYATKRERMHSTSGNAKRSIWPAFRCVAVAATIWATRAARRWVATGGVFTVCNPTTPYMLPGSAGLVFGMLAWGTTLEPAATPGTYGPVNVGFIPVAILDEAVSLARQLGLGLEAVVVWDQRSRGPDDITEQFLKEAAHRGIEVLAVPTF